MVKFLSEFAPLIAFFYGYKTGGILEATLYMVVVSVIGIVVTYIVERRINKVNLVTTALLLVSASLTLFSGNSIFIKMKPTVLYCLFALALFVTHFKWRPAIQYALGAAIKFKDQRAWYHLNKRFMFFFLLMAAANETIWRNFSEDIWVNFKVFGALPITIIFIMMQVPFIMKHKIDEEH
ncbi:MAG: septation protein IspZ [Rickettsiales bacterium]|nr:MAG: septation protein IspZ [Rickettsiales bacterium]